MLFYLCGMLTVVSVLYGTVRIRVRLLGAAPGFGSCRPLSAQRPTAQSSVKATGDVLTHSTPCPCFSVSWCRFSRSAACPSWLLHCSAPSWLCNSWSRPLDRIPRPCFCTYTWRTAELGCTKRQRQLSRRPFRWCC